MPPSLSELKVLPSFCFAFKILDDVTASNTYYIWSTFHQLWHDIRVTWVLDLSVRWEIWQIGGRQEKSRGCKTELHFKLNIIFEAIFYHEPKRTETISCIYVLLTCWSNHMHNKSKKLTIYVKLLGWNLCCQTCAAQWIQIFSRA